MNEYSKTSGRKQNYIREETLYVLRFTTLLLLHAKVMVQPVLALR